MGSALETIQRASISSPSSVMTPVTRPLDVVMRCTPQFMRASPPSSSNRARNALESAWERPLGKAAPRLTYAARVLAMNMNEISEGGMPT